MNASIEHPTDRPNFAIVRIGGVSLAFSYSTLVGFRRPGGSWQVHDNDWGPTTGKHLNWLDNGNKADRLSSEEFNKLADGLTIAVVVAP